LTRNDYDHELKLDYLRPWWINREKLCRALKCMFVRFKVLVDHSLSLFIYVNTMKDEEDEILNAFTLNEQTDVLSFTMNRRERERKSN
jgi:hypothetical protein